MSVFTCLFLAHQILWAIILSPSGVQYTTQCWKLDYTSKIVKWFAFLEGCLQKNCKLAYKNCNLASTNFGEG